MSATAFGATFVALVALTAGAHAAATDSPVSVTISDSALRGELIRDDVAIQAATGDTFIVQTRKNSAAEVLLLKDSDSTFEERIALLPGGADDETRFEIEMTPSGSPAYLIQSGNHWMVGSIERQGSRLVATHPFQSLQGTGVARSLTALPDGNLTITLEGDPLATGPARKGEILLLAPSLAPAARAVKPQRNASALAPASALSASLGVDESAFRIVETVSVETVEARANTLIATEDKAPKIESGNGLGFAAGALAGVGIAYRRHFANKWGIQIAGIAFGDASNLSGSLGVNMIRTLSRSQRVRFYALAGVSTFYSGFQASETAPWGSAECNETNPTCPVISTDWQNNVLLNFGAGIGMEIELTRNLGLALELPITVMLNLGNREPLLNGVYPIPSASLIYYF